MACDKPAASFKCRTHVSGTLVLMQGSWLVWDENGPTVSAGPSCCSFLFAAEAETHTCAEVRLQRGIPGDLFVAAVQHVLHVYVRGSETIQRQPGAGVHQSITGGVV